MRWLRAPGVDKRRGELSWARPGRRSDAAVIDAELRRCRHASRATNDMLDTSNNVGRVDRDVDDWDASQTSQACGYADLDGRDRRKDVLEAFPNLADVDDWDSSQRKDMLDMFSNLADVDDWDVSEMTAAESVRRTCQAVDGGANLEHAVRDDPATISFVAGADAAAGAAVRFAGRDVFEVRAPCAIPKRSLVTVPKADCERVPAA